MGLLDWLTDSLGSGASGAPMPFSPSPMVQGGEIDPSAAAAGMSMPQPLPMARSQPMPPAQGAGMDAPRLYDDAAGLPQAGAPPGVMYPPAGDPMTADRVPGAYPQGGDPMTADATAAPSPPYPMGGDPMTAGGPPPGGPGMIVNGQPVPVRPITREQFNDPGALPPGATSTMGNGTNGVGPGLGVATLDQLRASGQPEAKSIIGRALGLDPNREASLRGALGAGLKAAGENANKGKGAAFMGSAGSAIEGGKAADDKTTDQQDRYLQRAIQAKREGNHAEYQKNYLAYQIEATKQRLAAQKEKAASASVMNSPEQRYLRIDALAIKANGALKSQYEKTAQQFGVESKEAKAALEAYNRGVEVERSAQYEKHGLDPKKAAEIGKQPGMSDKNPVKDFPKDPAAAQKAFDALPEGAYFINPKDGRLLIKKGSGGAQGQNPAQGQQQSTLLPPMSPIPQDPNQEAA